MREEYVKCCFTQARRRSRRRREWSSQQMPARPRSRYGLSGCTTYANVMKQFPRPGAILTHSFSRSYPHTRTRRHRVPGPRAPIQLPPPQAQFSRVSPGRSTRPAGAITVRVEALHAPTRSHVHTFPIYCFRVLVSLSM